LGNPLSITQAFNWLKDKKNNLVDMVKKDVKEQAKISIAPPQHRREFLTYSISLLRSVSGENERQFFRISRKSPRLYSNTELAEFYRKLLTLRTHGYTIQAIAHFLHTEVEVLEKVEHLAMAAVEEAIEKAKVGAIPILGG
jgi:hypothetical protein